MQDQKEFEQMALLFNVLLDKRITTVMETIEKSFQYDIDSFQESLNDALESLSNSLEYINTNKITVDDANTLSNDVSEVEEYSRHLRKLESRKKEIADYLKMLKYPTTD